MSTHYLQDSATAEYLRDMADIEHASVPDIHAIDTGIYPSRPWRIVDSHLTRARIRGAADIIRAFDRGQLA